MGEPSSSGRSYTPSIIKGRWFDDGETFPSSGLIRREDCFRSWEEFYHSTGVAVPVMAARLKDDIKEITKYYGPSSFDVKEEYVSDGYDIVSGYHWRYPLVHERIYDRPEGGWIGIPAEHFRGGFRPNMHRFIFTLFRDVLKIAIAQMNPNSIRMINWYLSCCYWCEILPTFPVFFRLFHVSISKMRYTFELHFAGGNLEKFKPVSNPTNTRAWIREFIFVRGGDLEWTPCFADVYDQSVRRRYGQASEDDEKIIKMMIPFWGIRLDREDFFGYKQLTSLGLMAEREVNVDAFDAILAATHGQITIPSDWGKAVMKKRRDVAVVVGPRKKKKTEDDLESVIADVEKGCKLFTSAANLCKKFASDISNLQTVVAEKTRLVEEKESLVSQLTLQISALDLRVKELEGTETTLKNSEAKLKEDLRLEKERADKAVEDFLKVPAEEEIIEKFLKSDRFKGICNAKVAENLPIMYDQMRIYLKEDDGVFTDFAGWRLEKEKQEEEKAKNSVEKPSTCE